MGLFFLLSVAWKFCLRQGLHRTQGVFKEPSLSPRGPDLGGGFLFAVGLQLLSAKEAKQQLLGWC